MNVFLPRQTVAEALEREGQANVLLSSAVVDIDALDVELVDLNLKLTEAKKEFEGESIFEYFSLTCDRLLLPESAVDKLQSSLAGGKAQPVMTYLANAIERIDDSGNVVASVPYSIITGMDSSESLPLNYEFPNDNVGARSEATPLVINNWTAEQLDAQVGTPLRIAYYEPEVENGKEVERYFDAIVTSIVPITEPSEPYRRRRPPKFDQPPTVYNDSDLTPTVPGVTDQDSINDWDLPFPLKRKIEKVDDTYWNNHRLTPKAFMPLASARRRFGSRFGQTTSLRILPDTDDDLQSLQAETREDLRAILPDLGWHVRSIRQQQLAASRGTTPFDGLFLALSFFVIFSALMLISMLLRLGLVSRLPQFGALAAIGWTPKTTTKLVMIEGALISVMGVVSGVTGGIIYAHAVLWALRNWWVGAVTVPFLNFHWTLQSLLIGAVIGWVVAMLTVWLSVRGILTVRATTLLSGRDDSDSVQRGYQPPTWLHWALRITPLIAVAAAAGGATVGGQAAAGGFVGGGMMLLVTALMFVYVRLKTVGGNRAEGGDVAEDGDENESGRRLALSSLATRSASRSPLRSTLTIGLMATASFLIIAISAFRLQPTDRGTGGFDLLGQSAEPVYLSDPKVRSEWLGNDAALLEDQPIVAMRLRLGQDASCNNLYQAAQPTVLGVPPSMATISDQIDGGRFEWAGSSDPSAADTTSADSTDDKNPWSLLERNATGSEEDPIPMILDQNTAMWSLQMMKGVGEKKSFEYTEGKPIYFQVVGMLMNSVLQGKILIGESNFEEQFPDINGYRFFLIDAEDDRVDEVSDVLERRLGDVGMDVSKSASVLSGMLAVQNTYLRTFQSLGALGLLLGTIGLAIAQLRAVLQRRKELAVMRAMGFTRGRLAKLVMGETAALLLIGIGCGAICAVVAVLPHAWVSGIQPPVIEPLVIVGGIIVFGLLAGLLAVARVIRMPLLESLRAP